MNPKVITLLTDFGLGDEYVGVMKGVVACHALEVKALDICHNIPPGDIRGAAYMLAAAYGYFPAGSIHVCVVDPGVGSNRNILGAAFNGHFFMAPDNGLLTFLLDEPDARLYALAYTAPEHATFHGRDVIAPLASRLAATGDLAALGRPLAAEQAVRLANWRPEIDVNGIVRGRIVWRDYFGNLVTNICYEDLSATFGDLNGIMVNFAGLIFKWVRYYSEADAGTNLALINGRGHLELALNGGNLAQSLDLSRLMPLQAVTVCKYALQIDMDLS